ncbi:hypothetical protein [Salinivibrio sp. IB872]|jgi:hypothetical protein|uniref:hypothetical protein n=1 Tax=Salinivibrio sp. IB872 TaxID=1766123 RepID=UPI000986A15C|nr:hypothetical protein [Salinivibrio sp. IB872]OOF29473.1 hypothetical protein BZJ18_00230 [Salinivibrio sp. IB872]
MPTPTPDFGLPDDFDQYLDKLMESNGTDPALGEELRNAIIKSCREVNDKLSESFSDLSKTGFEPEDEANSEDDD